MGSILKRQKLSEDQHEDRISNLPNSLIAQILSRLPTKYAVSTSVLSTRWKQLWTSLSSLDFDDTLLSCPQNRSTDPLLQRSFTRFVCRVLLHHVSCVQRFRLKCCQSYDASLVNGWIADALLRNVRELDLSIWRAHSTRSIWREHSIMLPQDLFTCRTLVVLKLEAYGDMNSVPTSVSLPSLRILHLDCISFVDDDSINRFLFGCPVLEELSMIRCVGENVIVINIVAPTLTSLFMHNCLFDNRWLPHGFERKIVLDTPALLNLKIRDSARGGCYLVENLHHLIRADIFLYADYDSAISKALTDLLKGISNVQFLHLGFPMEHLNHLFLGEVTLKHDCQLPTKFPNMTCLELGEISDLHLKFLMEFLENSPRLETLVFKEGLEYLYDCEEFKRLRWSPNQNVPSCLLSHLKVIGISHFRGKKKEWKIVDYFLQNAKVLEKVNIDYGYGSPKWTIHASRT